VTSRRTPLRTRLLILACAGLGILLLLLAFSKPSVGRFLAAGLLIAAAVTIRVNASRPADPSRYTRAAQLRSVAWSIVIVVVFVGASWLLNEMITS
jgi:multisubunit Na+/H+ antiporter MnhB subunit